uniref:Crystallin beta/gamma motif-containing protein n=1 Tax=Podoviridae sp. ctuch15 TaxID=2827752 RepID=A0A8S5T1S7_9CAUD|nr:MAG TPA: crystallin beta/gamma motif-containing protein [Podoviridae sp. ctuch15]
MISDERKEQLLNIANSLGQGTIVTDNQAKGKRNMEWDLKNEHTDAEGKQWRQDNDYGGTLFDRMMGGWQNVADGVMEIQKNILYSTPETMTEAQRLGQRMSLSPQFLIDNPEVMDRVKEIDKETQPMGFMQGSKFSIQNFDALYPELAEMRQKDPVSASIAVSEYEDIKNTRSALDLIKDAFNSGSDMVKLSDAQMRAYNGESMDSVRPDVDKLTDELRAYQEPNKYERTLYDTIQQLTIMGTQAARATKRAAQGAAMGMATSAAAAGGAAATGIGAAAAPVILLAGATIGAANGMRVGMFEQFEQQSAAARYWELMNNRKGEYSRNHALVDSTVTGVVNGAIELGLMEVGYKPITKAWGGQAAKSILNNAAARMAIIDAGKESIAKLSAQAAMKQFGRSTAAELAEEGAQQASEDLMDNAEYYLYKKGTPHTTTEIIGNAVDAMVQAVPAVVGMGAMGSITHGVGNYRGMRAVAAVKNEDWKQEYRRTVEQQTIEALMANKAQNKTAQKNPEVYKNVVQEQARLAGVQNMYVDAQELSKTDKGVDVLNDMVNRGIITGEQVDKSISTGADIVIPTGTFAQLADESVDTDTLMRATTMAKNGVHRAALEEKAKRVEAIREELANLAQNKKDVLSKELMEEHFSDADDITKTAAESVIYKNPYDLNKSYKEALTDARKEYEDALGFDAYWNYKPQGVGIMYTDEESRQTGRGIRVSNNDYWYQDMYKKLGRKATREEMLDIAYEDQMKELQTLAPETADEFAQNANSLKAKYEALQGLKDKFEELAKSDYAVKQSLTKEGYEAYNEVLNKFQDGSDKSKLAANENAFIYARMAESWAKIRNEYGDTAYTAKDFAAAHPIRIGTAENKKAAQFEQREFADKVKANESIIAQGKEYILTALKGEETAPTFTLWKLSDVEVKRIKEELRINLSGYTLELVADDIRHARKRHGSGKKKGEIVLTNKLLQHALDILVTPDEVVLGNRSSEGLPSIRFIKYENDGTMTVVENIYTKEKKLRLKTMWKDAPATVDAQGPDHTSEYNGGDASFHKNSIAKEGGKNKSKESGYAQRAWHGSGMDFNEFNLEKALTGAGDMVHGWGIYTAKNKKTAQAYKKHAKNKGLPSYLYEVDIPEDTNLLAEEKRYQEQPSEIQEKLARTISDLPDSQQKTFWEKPLRNEMRRLPEETEALSDLDKAKDKVKQLEVASNGLENTDKPKLKEKIAIKHLKALGYIDKQIKDPDFMQTEKEKEEKVLAAVKKEAEKAEVAIQKRKDSILEAAIKNPKEALKRSVGTGKEIYKYLSASLESMEEASQRLNKNGIEGISYYDSEDGNCVVVFSDKAVNIIDKYRQEIKASYNSATGAIHLFDGADQSSFVHEAAHMYLTEMSKMAIAEAAPKGLLEDWNTIQEWAVYKPEDIKDYEGTAREKEFKSYAKAIEDARKSGDAIAIRAAEERWMQERFARGFERYIAEGKAPSQALQSAFRKFKSWLVSIYRDLTNLGKEPPEEVKRVMDRMLATNDEIEAWAKAKELNAWDKKGFSGDLTGSEGDMIKRWAEDAKEKAKERVLKELMRQEENQWRTDLENSLEKERIDYEKHLVDENPIYGQELVYRETDEQFKEDYLRTIGYDSKESFESAIEKAGGPLEERSKAFMENRRKEYEEMMPTSEDFKNAADAELASTNAQMRLSQLEAYAIKRKVNGYVAEAVKAMRELDALDGKSEEEITAGIKEILGVDDEAAKKGRQVALMLAKNEEIQKLKERLKDAKEKDKEHRASAREELASAKAALKEAMRGLNTARDITAGSYTKTLQIAREELSKMTVAEATTWRHWEIKAKQEGNNADKLMAAGAFEEAAIAKGNSLKYYCMSRAAKDNQEYVRIKLEGSTGRVDIQQEAMDGIKGMVKRIGRKENPVRLDPNSRYMIQHLAYITGITEKDGIKPLNEKGEPVGINWEKVYGDLNPDYAMDKETAPNPDKIVAPWLRILAESKERKDYNEMQMDRFQDMVEAMNVLYKASRRDYEATTIKDRNGKVISQEEAAMKLVQAIGVDNEFNPLQDSNNQTDAKSKAKSLAKDALLYLTKAETIFNRFGGDWMQLVYEPINQGANKELTMRQEACKTFSKIYNMYSLEEWQAMRSDRVFTIGLTTNFTREQLICMALNWGNKEGRKRVLATINKSAKNEADVIDEYTMQSVLESSLTEKDWNFIEAVWEQLDSYWAERNKVQENLYGQGLGKVQALPFKINGRQIKGGYYPIIYDPKLSIRASDLAADDIVKQALSGSSTFGIGMGSTKSRVSEVKGQQLALRLDVWPQAVTEAIHHIAMREAATDVYKLITHPAVQQAVQQKYGMETYNMIRQWSKDVWKTDVQKADIINRTLEQMRKNSAFAVMAMRTGTALLNVLNVFPMMHQIGKMNTLKAITSFGLGLYKGTDTYARNRQFVFDKSPMMRDRMNTIDRDMQQDMKIEVGQDTSLIRERATHAKEKFNRFGYWFITETDLMFSMALWKHGYDESMRKQIEAGMTDVKQMEQNAISDADTNVRAVFGSGQVKDQVAMQRKNTLVGQLTPFYSYSSTVLNALIKAGYRVKDHGDYMALINATLYWVVLQTLAETVYRSAVAGELDDPDKMLRRLGITTVRNVDQGFPVVRDALEGVMNHFLLGSDSNNSPLAITAIDELVKAAQAAGNEKKDFTDVGRSLSRVGNRTWKFSDTLSDGFWNLVRFSLIDTDRSVQELITTTIFDKRYKTHEERVRQDKRKANEQKRKDKR